MNSPVLQQRPLPRHNSSLRTPRAGTRCRQARPLLRTLGILVALVLGSSSCGLPTIPFLDPPKDPGFDGGSPENRVLTFSHNPNNDGDDFQGYELYYKLYTDDQSQLIDADTNFIEATPQQPGPSRLITRGFVRAAAVRELQSLDPETFSPLTSDRPPHIPTDPTGAPIEYEIDLEDRTNADPDEDVFLFWTQGGEQRRGFRRRSDDNAFTADPTELKSFWNRSEYSPDDWDIARMGLSDEIEAEPQPDKFSIVWYVLSYGIDATTFGSYYSEPLRLSPAVIVLRNP